MQPPEFYYQVPESESTLHLSCHLCTGGLYTFQSQFYLSPYFGTFNSPCAHVLKSRLQTKVTERLPSGSPEFRTTFQRRLGWQSLSLHLSLFLKHTFIVQHSCHSLSYTLSHFWCCGCVFSVFLVCLSLFSCLVLLPVFDCCTCISLIVITRV